MYKFILNILCILINLFMNAYLNKCIAYKINKLYIYIKHNDKLVHIIKNNYIF